MGRLAALGLAVVAAQLTATTTLWLIWCHDVRRAR